MVLCKYSALGQECPVFQTCQDEHINIKDLIKTEIETAINGDQWPLSSFGPFTEKPSIPNYIEDKSFEEIRMLFYGTGFNSYSKSCQQFLQEITEAKIKMQMLITVNKEVMEMLVRLYNFGEPLKKSIPFALRAAENSQHSGFFGKTSEKVALSPFGEASRSGLQLFGGQKKFHFGPASFGVQDFNTASSSQQTQNNFGFFGSKELKKIQNNTVDTGSSQTDAKEKESNKFQDHLEDIAAKMDKILSQINENKQAISQQEKEMSSVMEFVKKMTIAEETRERDQKKEEEKKESTRPTTLPPLLIKPKQKQRSEKTKEDIKSRIDPLSLSIRIVNITHAAQGAIVVRCKNKESIQKLRTEVKEKCSEEYETELLRLANPRIMVTSIENEIDADNLIRLIKQQNEIDGDMTLIRCFEKNQQTYNALIEVSKDVYNLVMDGPEPFLNVGWTRCYIFDNVRVRRCYNCWGFNHNAKQCRNDTRCPKCGGEHVDRNCSSPRLRCSNCIRANLRRNLKLDIRHDSRNYNCHVYLSQLQKERDRIDY